MIGEVLFRGKHIHVITGNEALNGVWIYGYLSDKNYINSIYYKCEKLVDPETISMYCGKKDKNGKKIFGGDILELEDRYVEVVYDTRFARWDCRFLKHNGSTTNSRISFKGVEPKDFYKYTVVGNRWDNPELLA